MPHSVSDHLGLRPPTPFALRFISSYRARRYGMRRRLVVAVTALLSLSIPAALWTTTSYAATDPPLGDTNTFAILSSTYSNAAGGTTLNGDLGYTTAPATNPTVNGTTYASTGIYPQAGTDQATALANLNGQSCSFSFAAGAVDLATDTTHGPVGVYTPGVYCVSGAASVGTAGIVLNGQGTYIFRETGALTSAANSVVSLSGTASACDVFWTPGGATTLGANSTFLGTDVDPAGINIGNITGWVGRALAFGGTVSTSADTISATTCSTSTSTTTTTPTPVTTTTPVATTTVTTTPVATPTTTASATPVVATTSTTTPKRDATTKSATTTTQPKSTATATASSGGKTSSSSTSSSSGTSSSGSTSSSGGTSSTGSTTSDGSSTSVGSSSTSGSSDGGSSGSSTVPSTSTGEPWSGWPYWVLVAASGALGIETLRRTRRRNLATHEKR